MLVAEGAGDVGEDTGGVVDAPEEAGGEEGGDEEDAVVELEGGAGEAELVEEPVDVEEGGGELVEDEGRGVEVEDRPLEGVGVSAWRGLGLCAVALAGAARWSLSCRRVMSLCMWEGGRRGEA